MGINMIVISVVMAIILLAQSLFMLDPLNILICLA